MAGTITGQMLAAKQACITGALKCNGTASISKIGWHSCKRGRRTRPSFRTTRACNFASFQALFCRTSSTFSGLAACKPGNSRARKVAKFPTMTWGRRGYTSGLSQTKAMWVKQVRRFLRFARWMGSASGGSLRFRKSTVPLLSPCHKQTDVSSMLIRNTVLPTGPLPDM